MESAYLAPSLRAAVLVLAMPLTGVAARAQCSYPDIQLGNFICSPAETSGAYSSIASGDLNGNFSPEVGVIRGGSLIVYHDVDSENVAVVAAEDAIDVCYSPCAAGPDSPGFLYTSASGLRRVVYDAVENEYETAEVAATSLWQATTRIRWADTGIGPSKLTGLVGWAPSLDTISFCTMVDGLTSLPTSQFTYTPDVTAMALLDWDGVAGLELAVLHGTGLHILDQSGTVLLSRTASVPGDAITAVRCEGYKDSLAWATRMPNGTSALLLFNFDFPGNHFQGPLLLGTDVYSSIAAGDLIAPQGSGAYAGPDGDEDLVLASSTASILRIYRVDTSATGDWISSTHRTMDLTGPYGTATPTGPVLCDNLFNDWTADGDPIPSIAVALSAPNGLRVKPEPMARPDEIVEDYTTVEYRSGLYLDGCSIPEDPPISASEWRIRLGDGWGSTTATEIQMVVRLCEEGEDEVEPGVYHSETFPLSGQGQIVDTEIYFDALETSEDGLDCELSQRKYFVKIRPRNASQAWRWSIISVSPHCEGIDWLQDLPGASDTFIDMVYNEAWFSCGPPAGCATGGEYIPVAVPQIFIPSSPGVLPEPPPQ
jgi:hypothetical protein